MSASKRNLLRDWRENLKILFRHLNFPTFFLIKIQLFQTKPNQIQTINFIRMANLNNKLIFLFQNNLFFWKSTLRLIRAYRSTQQTSRAIYFWHNSPLSLASKCLLDWKLNVSSSSLKQPSSMQTQPFIITLPLRPRGFSQCLFSDKIAAES